jgi:hypothetical protein
LLKAAEHPLNSWRPRPDRPELHDQQTAFLNDHDSRYVFALGGNMLGRSAAACVNFCRALLHELPPLVQGKLAWAMSATGKAR